MKIQGVVIGKRVTVGAAITSTAAALTHLWPDHGALFVSLAVPITLLAQIWIANKFGITS